VVESNGDPVRKAVVTVTWQGQPRSWATQRTDASGKFQFENLPAGKYDLRATKAGIGTAVYGATTTHELGDVLILEDGGTLSGLKLRFIHTSSVTGRVVDAEGDPVQGANVSLMRAGRNLGQRVLVNTRQAMSNDRGEYRITGIDPGQYYLHAAIYNTGRARRLASGQFLGGATETKDAVPIVIKSGENATGLDFRLTTAPGVEIHGHLTGLPGGPQTDPQHDDDEALHPTPQVFLSRADDSMIGWRQGTAANPNDGVFYLPEVPAGRYRVQASVQIGKRGYSAWQIIDVQPGMGDLEVPMVANGSVKGQFIIEGESAQKPSNFQMTLNAPNVQSIPAKVAADGTFELEQVPAGEWTVNLNPVPRGGYIKSIHLGDKDVRFSKFTVEPGSDAVMKVVVSMRTATIEGDTGSKRAGVLLAPIGEFHDLTRFYYSVASDDEGKFKMLGIAPGKYRVFALEKMAAANFRSPEAADQLGELGEEIELTEGAHVTVHPRLIPTERAREALP